VVGAEHFGTGLKAEYVKLTLGYGKNDGGK